jgi:Family of unknown function (DUF5955)
MQSQTQVQEVNVSSGIKNSGIFLTGGSFQAENVAVGGGAKATTLKGREGLPDHDREKLRTALDLLIAQLEKHGVLDQQPVEAAVTDLERETAKDAPDKGRIEQLLSRICETAGSVTAVAKAVATVHETVKAFL